PRRARQCRGNAARLAAPGRPRRTGARLDPRPQPGRPRRRRAEDASTDRALSGVPTGVKGGGAMQPTRRDFLRLGLGTSTVVACEAAVPLFLARSAAALAAEPTGNPKGRILVVLQLDGGNDGLNTVVPYRDDEYRKHRPKLHVSADQVHKIDDRI